MTDKNIMSEEQVEKIAEILMQYAPENWIRLFLLFKTDDDLSQIETCAETPSTQEHGFQLDDADADSVEKILAVLWEDNNKSWSVAEFILENSGEYTISFD